MPIATEKEIYGDYKMLHPDGSLMCYCNEKKATWYMSRKLAKWIDKNTFQLTFEPGGKGKSNIKYYTQSLENRCVICGSQDNLNRHHVFPYVFRSRFPLALKTSNHHDILPTCVDCHEAYENEATEYKSDLAIAVGFSISSQTMTDSEKNNRRIYSARKLIEKYEKGLIKNSKGEKVVIPEHALLEIKAKAQEPIDESAMHRGEGSMWADAIMEKVLNEDRLFEFVKSWREHFVKHAKPKYLPKFWSIDHPLEVSNKY